MAVLKRIFLWLYVAILVISASFFGYYFYFKTSFISELKEGSKVINTALGPVEYALVGATEGPVILYIHGTPGGYDRALTLGNRYRFLVPSRPGYLRTPLSSGETPEAQAKLYKALLDKLDINSVIVWGSSGGGPSAIEFATRYPETTKGMISLQALSSSWENRPPGAESLTEQSDLEVWFLIKLFEFMGDEAIVEFFLPNPKNQNMVLSDQEELENLKKLFWSIWPISLRKEGYDNDFENYWDLSLPLDKLDIPILAIHGTEDINVNIRHSEELVKSAKDARLHVVNGGDHSMPFSHDEEIDKVVDDFITEIMTN